MRAVQPNGAPVEKHLPALRIQEVFHLAAAPRMMVPGGLQPQQVPQLGLNAGHHLQPLGKHIWPQHAPIGRILGGVEQQVGVAHWQAVAVQQQDIGEPAGGVPTLGWELLGAGRVPW